MKGEDIRVISQDLNEGMRVNWKEKIRLEQGRS